MAVYLPEDISLQREKAHQGHAVMLREAFLRQHRPLLHVHNATIQSVLPVTSPASNISVFNNLFSVPCNFLDEIHVGSTKTDLHNDLYTCVDHSDRPCLNYICMSCQPFFLKSIKLENDYKQAEETFQERQRCSNSTNLDGSCEESNPVRFNTQCRS